MIQAAEQVQVRTNRNVLDDYADEAIKKFSDPKQQRAWALKKVLADKAFLEEYMVQVISEAIARRVYILRGQNRASMKRFGRPRDAETLRLAAKSFDQGLLKTWIVKDKPLGLCTKQELAVAKESESERAAGHKKNSMLYDAMIKRLPDDDAIVQDHWTDNDAQAVFERIYK